MGAACDAVHGGSPRCAVGAGGVPERARAGPRVAHAGRAISRPIANYFLNALRASITRGIGVGIKLCRVCASRLHFWFACGTHGGSAQLLPPGGRRCAWRQRLGAAAFLVCLRSTQAIE